MKENRKSLINDKKIPKMMQKLAGSKLRVVKLISCFGTEITESVCWKKGKKRVEARSRNQRNKGEKEILNFQVFSHFF